MEATETNNKINLTLKMFMKLKKYLPADASDGEATISLDEGATLKDLKSLLGIPVDDFEGIVIDKVHSEIEDEDILKDGETLTFYAAVAGG